MFHRKQPIKEEFIELKRGMRDGRFAVQLCNKFQRFQLCLHRERQQRQL